LDALLPWGGRSDILALAANDALASLRAVAGITKKVWLDK
jgi:hypothetical protein